MEFTEKVTRFLLSKCQQTILDMFDIECKYNNNYEKLKRFSPTAIFNNSQKIS